MGRYARKYLIVCLAVSAVGDGNWASADQPRSSTLRISQRQPPLEAAVETEGIGETALLVGTSTGHGRTDQSPPMSPGGQ